MTGAGKFATSRCWTRSFCPWRWKRTASMWSRLLLHITMMRVRGMASTLTTTWVRLSDMDILPSAVLVGSNWDADNHRWRLLRESGNLYWRGKYEMRPFSFEEMAANGRDAGNVLQPGGSGTCVLLAGVRCGTCWFGIRIHPCVGCACSYGRGRTIVSRGRC